MSSTLALISHTFLDACAEGDSGDALSKYGRTKCNMAIVSESSTPPAEAALISQAQEEFGNRLRENYIAGMGELA